MIEKLARPKTVEELRQAIHLLLVDHFEGCACIARQGSHVIEYRDQSGDDEPVEADIVIIDAFKHTMASDTYDRWEDDAEPDDYAARKARHEVTSFTFDPSAN